MGKYSNKLAKLEVKLEKKIRNKVERIQEAVAEVAISLTEQPPHPYDTGLASANWIPSVGTPDMEYLDFEYFGIDPSTLSYPNLRHISEVAARKIATNIPNFSLGETLYLTNSVPHRKTAISNSVLQAGRSQMIDLGQAEANK